MDNEPRLLAMRELAKSYLEQSVDFIRDVVPRRLLAELDAWLPKRRLLDPAIFINRAICDLEDHVYGERELKISILAGSTAAVSDDIIDSQSDISHNKLRLLEDYERSVEGGNLGLFYAFNQGLLRVLPSDFRARFKEIIDQYNRAQEDSAKLFDPSITKGEIIDIKNRAGGYSILLLHAMISSGERIIVDNLDYLRYPMTKQEALYTYGAWLSRVDDLWDIRKDRLKWMKQLATERIITWESLPSETQRMKEGLETHFPRTSVERVIEEHYAPLIDMEIFTKYGESEE